MEILEKDNGELKVCFKMNRVHVDLPEGAKTNVRIAAQTLSHSVACAMEYIDSSKKQQAEVIQTVNDVRMILSLI